MIGRSTLALVLLVSSAHALVHTYEQSLPSVEQRIAAEYFPDDAAAGKAMTGRLSNTWRLMWGIGGIAAGWLVDYIGGRRMLGIYLLGCSAACAWAALSGSKEHLFWAMLLMGGFASIYHPAGLTLISHETNPANRARAQGIHGVFGSLGIGTAPLLVGVLFSFSVTWRQVYWVLSIPGILLGFVFIAESIRHHSRRETQGVSHHPSDDRERADWLSFAMLTLLAAMQGYIYSAVTSFLPRYLAGGLGFTAGSDRDSVANYLAAGVLFIGCFGQFGAGRWARQSSLERQITIITFGSVPFLAWMAVATGMSRPIAAGLLTLVHFMHQPIYNTLIAKYTPRRQRGIFYGISFAMGQGVGSFGAGFAGQHQSDLLVYGVLAGIAAVGGLIGLSLTIRNAYYGQQGEHP